MKSNPKDSGVKRLTNCRICKGTDLSEFLDLGSQPLANSFLTADKLDDPEAMFPLRVSFCQNCDLVQLSDVVDPALMFSDYVYHSSGMPASQHFREYAESIVKNWVTNPDDLVVEIGSNDGHFLAVVKEMHDSVLGIDPAQNLAEIAVKRGVPTIADFFSEQLARKVFEEKGEAKVIVANNVVAHIDNHHDLVKGVKALLAKDGVFVFEAPYLVDMFENLAFDTIYHEHLSYLAMRPLVKLFAQFDMEIFDVEIHKIQGYSLRVFAGNEGAHRIKKSVSELLEKEKATQLDQLAAYNSLAEKIKHLRVEVVELLNDFKKDGKRIAAYGAPAKGNTLLNYFQIDPEILDYATEGLPAKMGLYTPGMKIPVVDIAESRKDPPDYYFVLAWNYLDGILEKEQEFREKHGGKFIVPIGDKRIY